MRNTFYEFIDHTADLGFIVRAGSRKELYEKTARAVFDIIVDLPTVRQDVIQPVEVSGDDREQLMVNWLNELLFLYETRGMLFRSFDIKEINDNHLKAECSGESYRAGVHRIKKEIKAATYHQILVSEDRDGWTLRIIFDI
jgi:SHS2 domain-containing protein